MTLRLATIVLDVPDMKRSAAFWQDALGYEIDSDIPGWIGMRDPKGKGPNLGLQPRKDVKPSINHVHIDLATRDVEGEVKRLEKLGATRADWPYYPEGANWVVMRDPEGNEFCVVPEQ